MIRLLLAIVLVLMASPGYTSTTITAQAVRNQTGTGSVMISSGFPFPPGLVSESLIAGRKIKVLLSGVEVAANVSALRGRHQDGTVRSALIQFTASMAEDEVIPAQVIVDGGVRAETDPQYVRPTLAIIQNNNVISPTDPDYITTTLITFQKLLPSGNGTAAEEAQYTTLASDRFDALVLSGLDGTARYEEVRAMLALWARTGNNKFFNHAVTYSVDWLDYSTPGSAASPDCKADEYVNPDGRTVTANTICGVASEWQFARVLSYASIYLLTGYRDFWSVVAYNAQLQQAEITDQTSATTNIIKKDFYDLPRFNYATRYGALLAATMIDATMPISGQWVNARQMDFEDQLDWTLNAIKNAEWNLQWIPFNSGSGNVPATGTTITQGAVSATLLGVSAVGKFDPLRYAGKPMPATGYIQVNAVTGGSFSAGALSGITATATGANVADYRQGMTGTRSDSPKLPNIDTVTGSISGTTLTVTAVGTGVKIDVGTNISGSGISDFCSVVSQISGTPNGVGTYTISDSYTLSSRQITVSTVIPNFQMVFITNFLIDYYLNIKADSRIPAMVKTNLDILLNQIHLMEAGDTYYGVDGGTWGDPLYGKPYALKNPVATDTVPPLDPPYELPEYARIIAFVVKTSGEATVNGANYSTWYTRLIDTANNSPIGVLTWEWKVFGQFYGWGSDAPWMMAQTSLSGPESIREPVFYSSIPGDTPDGVILGNASLNGGGNAVLSGSGGLTITQ